MDTKTWQHLLGLESVDVVRRWFHEISGLQLSKTRADEIASAAKQSREYFNNASNAASIVKSLLTFYGVASLARSMILLLKRDGGEITLGRGHGLNTIDWPSTLSGEIPTALRSIGNLKIRTSAGLFNDLVRQTSNLSCIHLRSSTVDWRIRYPQQEIGFELTFEEILSRVPDLMKIVNSPSATHHLASVNEVTCSARDGFQAMINPKQFELFQDSYINEGYAVTRGESLTALKCTFHHFQTNLLSLCMPISTRQWA